MHADVRVRDTMSRDEYFIDQAFDWALARGNLWESVTASVASPMFTFVV